MKIQVRQNVFETNSSSMHSLVVSNKDRGYDYNLPVDKNGVLTISFGVFGWEPEILKEPLEKISYVITDRCSIGSLDFDEKEALESEIVKEVIDLIKSRCPNVKDVKIQRANSYRPYGYVDHQSQGTSYEDKDLEHLIFSNSVIIIINNDNDSNYEDYFVSRYGTPAKYDIEDSFEK